MDCPKCQFPNEDTAKFCNECGNRLEIVCPQCGKGNQPGSKFCNECGQALGGPERAPPVDYAEPHSYTPKHLTDKILTARSSLEGERKLVTVLFADVANYTSISEKLDPEDVHGIMNGCFRIVMDEAHEQEGTINQFTGDGVMALFGAPVAHEDHARRACRAALSIQKGMDQYSAQVKEEYGVEFQMRIGLNSGPVIVAAIGDDLRMDYTAVGDTTNLAARVQQAARPGEVWLSEETHQIVRGYFQEEAVGEVALKGKTRPQQLFRLTAERPEVRTRFEAGLVGGVTEFVGRKSEMESLQSAFAGVEGGEAQVVDVVGEAGVGKTRLVFEFLRLLSVVARCLTGVCVHYGRSINFLPLIDIVRAAFGITEDMSEEEVVQKIDGGATGELAPMISFYRNLLSLPVNDPKFNELNSEGRKFGTFEALKNLLLWLSGEQPLVLFLEDVHWIDKISEEFFTYLSRCIRDHRVLMLSAYRPEGDPPWAQVRPHDQGIAPTTSVL
jgi:class 3 adenylate cyclase